MQPAYLCPVTVFQHSSFLSSARKCLNSSHFRLTTSPTLHHKPLALRHSLVKPPAPRHLLLQALRCFLLGPVPPLSPRLRRAGGGPQGQPLPHLSHEVFVHLHHRDSHYNPHHRHTLRLHHPFLLSGNGPSRDWDKHCQTPKLSSLGKWAKLRFFFFFYVSLENTNTPTSKKVSKARKTRNYHVSRTSSSRSSSGSPRV